ncbi:MAG TPA: T9SS type A sorting domain-containing protein, partial [Bacteroidales bacterium]|nr:T9SS type A sorting domain-containing protein [Bacteroidales bacterium]
KVLPTVFSNHIQIQLSQKPDNNWSYSLYAINGKMITSQKLVEDITISDFSSLSEGIYFLQVKSKNDSKYFKIIKQ